MERFSEGEEIEEEGRIVKRMEIEKDYQKEGD